MKRDRTPPFVAAQIVGGREKQQDHFAILELRNHNRVILLFVVADGMSGHKAAAEAAQLATRLFGETIRTGEEQLPERLTLALYRANAGIALEGTENPAFRGAGCTLVGAALENGALSWISIGDSSLYLFRQGTLRKLNTAHTETFDPGTGVAVKVLRAALTGKKLELIDRSEQPLHLIPGDCIMLATDGLDCVDDRKITSILRRSAARTPTEIVGQLLSAVHARPLSRQDNTTIVFYRMPGFERNFDRTKKQTSSRSKWTALIIISVLGIVIALTVHWLLP